MADTPIADMVAGGGNAEELDARLVGFASYLSKDTPADVLRFEIASDGFVIRDEGRGRTITDGQELIGLLETLREHGLTIEFMHPDEGGGRRPRFTYVHVDKKGTGLATLEGRVAGSLSKDFVHTEHGRVSAGAEIDEAVTVLLLLVNYKALGVILRYVFPDVVKKYFKQDTDAAKAGTSD